jgi:16S rRNA (uracil1498-N3)-methyltransferase
MHRVRVEALGRTMRLPPAEVRHLQVLRLRPGETLRVFDGQGGEATATLSALDELSATLTLGEVLENVAETPQPVTLAIALLKGDKLSDVVRAGTELGVTTFQLLTTRHADVPEIGDAKLTRLRRVALEASKQSRRAVTPEVRAPVPLKTYAPDGLGVYAHPGAAYTLPGLLDWQRPLTLLSGPEGGLSAAEVAGLDERGFIGVTLGPRILRAETAPLALLGAIAASGV